jgi:Zn-dependent protease with chaperone function
VGEVTESFCLEGISPKAYEHPADRAATAALASIPHLDTVVRKLIELGYERALRQALLGASVRLGESQLPELWAAHLRVYRTLDIDAVPDLYLTTEPYPNAMTIGSGRPLVVLRSGLVTLLDEDGHAAVLAHEAGHVLSDHVLYRTALLILLRIGGAARLPVGLMPVRAALLEWHRASELSCDRAAALATRDPLALCRALMVLAGGAAAERLDLDAFMRQATDYQEKGSLLERLSRLAIDLNVTHGMPVRRVHELTAWVRGGDYDRIVGGEYLRRGEPVDARVQAGDAAAHYGERFAGFFRDAGESAQQAMDQLGEWLKRTAAASEQAGGDGEDDLA